MSRLIDITPKVTPGLAVFPGDVPYARDVSMSVEGGDHIGLSSVTTTLHLGAHTDAPNHYLAGGAGIGERPLDLYYGPCQVMHVDVARGSRVLPADLPGPITAPRLLLATGTFPNPDHFNLDFAALSPELVAHAHDAGVRLVGIDTPSIDPAQDKELPSHAAVAARDMAILEGIVLDGVPAGTYTLIALPLKLAGADASPVRAVLVAG